MVAVLIDKKKCKYKELQFCKCQRCHEEILADQRTQYLYTNTGIAKLHGLYCHTTCADGDT